MIQAEVNDTRLSGGQKFSRIFYRKILAAAAKKLKWRRRYQLSLAFVAAPEMKRINLAYRKKNVVTDVLSFGDPAEKNGFLGEILICYPQAAKQAKAAKVSVREEVRRLIAHGLLHLAGYDHVKIKEAEKMFKLQEEILSL